MSGRDQLDLEESFTKLKMSKKDETLPVSVTQELRQQNEDFRTLLERCNFEVPDDTEEAIKTLKIAQNRNLPRWTARCVQVLQEKLTPGNVIPLYLFAHEKDKPIPELQVAAFNFMVKNFLEIYKLEDFKKLRLSQLTELLQQNELKVTKEEEVFYAVAKWVTADMSNRKKNIDVLIPVVRLCLCDITFLKGLKDHYLLFEMEDIQRDMTQVIEDAEANTPDFQERVKNAQRTPKTN